MLSYSKDQLTKKYLSYYGEGTFLYFVGAEGVEPTTPRLQITCSGQLSYIGIVVFPHLEKWLS